MNKNIVWNVFQLLRGNTAARIIGLLMLPVLSRIYSPEAFGLYSFFIQAVGLVFIVASMNLTQCIVVAESSKVKRGLICLIALSGGGVAFLLCVVSVGLFFWGEDKQVSLMLSVLAFSAIVYSAYEVIQSLMLRSKEYSRLGYLELQRASLNSLCNGLLFALFPGFGLILSEILSRLVLIFKFVITGFDGRTEDASRGEIGKIQIHKVFCRFRDYVFYGGGSNILISGAFLFPAIIFGGEYGAAALGMFALIQRVIDIPYSLIASASGKVFLAEGVELVHKKGPFKTFFYSAVIKLSLVAVGGNLVVGIVVYNFCGLLFGEEWAGATSLVAPLVFLSIVRTVVSPISQVAVILNKQKYEALMSFFRIACLVLVFVFVSSIDLSFDMAVMVYCAVMSITYLLFLLTYRFFVNVYESEIST